MEIIFTIDTYKIVGIRCENVDAYNMLNARIGYYGEKVDVVEPNLFIIAIGDRYTLPTVLDDIKMNIDIWEHKHMERSLFNFDNGYWVTFGENIEG